MLCVSPASSSSETNIAAGLPRNGGWDVAVREDKDGIGFIFADSSQFQFLYVPYDAIGLIGGHVDGSNRNLINSAGDTQFSLTRSRDGEYALSVFEDEQQQTKLTEDDGMLILSVTGHMVGEPDLPDRSFLSYEYDSQTGHFIIRSRELAQIFSPNSENQFGDWLKLRDSEFYFAWVDFDDPLRLTEPLEADFTEDGVVDGADLAAWEVGYGATSLAQHGDGDADGDGDVDGADFVVWQRQLGSSANAGAIANAAVPEPSTCTLVLLTLLGLGIWFPGSNGVTAFESRCRRTGRF